MSTLSFNEFVVQKKRLDVFNFLDNYEGVINESTKIEVYALFGNDDIVNEAWDTWWNKAKEIAGKAYDTAKNVVQGAKNFGTSFSKAAKKSYGETATDENVKAIENAAVKIAEASKAFSKKYKIDPITAGVIIASGMTGGIGAIPMTILAMALRRGSGYLASKGMDAAWKKVTGHTPEELDKMWQNELHGNQTQSGQTQAQAQEQPQAQAQPQSPQTGKIQAQVRQPQSQAGKQNIKKSPLQNQPNTKQQSQTRQLAKTQNEPASDYPYRFSDSTLSFQSFLESRDQELYENLANEGFKDRITGLIKKGTEKAQQFAQNWQDKGFGHASGDLLGTGAGIAAGYARNIAIVIGKSLKNMAKFMVNNPVKTSTMLLALWIGSKIGSVGTKTINDLIYKPSANQIGELASAAKEAGVPNNEIKDLYDSSYSGTGGDFGDATDTSYSGTGGDFGGGSKNIPNKRWIDPESDFAPVSSTAPDAEKFLPPKGTQTYYANKDTNWKTMPYPGSPEDIAFKKSFLPK